MINQQSLARTSISRVHAPRPITIELRGNLDVLAIYRAYADTNGLSREIDLSRDLDARKQFGRGVEIVKVFGQYYKRISNEGVLQDGFAARTLVYEPVEKGRTL